MIFDLLVCITYPNLSYLLYTSISSDMLMQGRHSKKTEHLCTTEQGGFNPIKSIRQNTMKSGQIPIRSGPTHWVSKRQKPTESPNSCSPCNSCCNAKSSEFTQNCASRFFSFPILSHLFHICGSLWWDGT